MNLDGGNLHRVCPQASLPPGPCVADDAGQGEISRLAWSPTGAAIALTVEFPGQAVCFTHAEGDYILDLDSESLRSSGYGLIGPLKFSPDGRFVASGAHDCKGPDTVSVSRVEGGGTASAKGAGPVGWAPRSLRLLYERGTKDSQGGYAESFLAAIDPYGGHRWTMRLIPEVAPAWSPSGLRIAFFRESGPRRGLYVVHLGRHDARRLLRFRYSVSLSAWSRNGTWIAFGGPRGTYFVRSNGTGLHRLTGAPILSPFSPLLWSPDSSHFAFVDSEGIVRVVTPPQPAAVAVTTAADLDVCRIVIDVPVCQIGWAGNRLIFASAA
jgi:WD40 repeat protein